MRPGRRRFCSRVTGLIAAAALCAAGAQAALPERPIDFELLRGEFPPADVIAEGASACYRLDTLLAETNAQRARGLMFVRSMPEDAGLLFVYPRPRELSMWMKNTILPLDILFADAGGKVIRIAADTTPLSLDSIRSGGPARFVLELNAGTAGALGLETGSRLHIL